MKSVTSELFKDGVRYSACAFFFGLCVMFDCNYFHNSVSFEVLTKVDFRLFWESFAFFIIWGWFGIVDLMVRWFFIFFKWNIENNLRFSSDISNVLNWKFRNKYFYLWRVKYYFFLILVLYYVLRATNYIKCSSRICITIKVLFCKDR